MRLRAIDLRWAALDPAQSIVARIERTTERTVSDADVHDAMRRAPRDTRAWLRAEVINRYPDQVVAASWSHLTVRRHGAADEAQTTYGNASRTVTRPSDLCSLDMSDPLAFTAARMEPLVRRSQNAEELIGEITAQLTVDR